MKAESWMRWDDGDSEVKLIETETELRISVVTLGVEIPVATYKRGQIRSILELHAGGTCTLRVQTDNGLEKEFHCPAVICHNLKRKLRSFQGANPVASQPEENLLVDKFDVDSATETDTDTDTPSSYLAN